MRGKVIGFDAQANIGAIEGDDGQRYDFNRADWRSQTRPTQGDLVEFRAGGQRAVQINPIEPDYVAPSLGEFLFSPRGRVSRAQFWLKWLLPVLAIHLLFGIAIGGAFAADGYRAALILTTAWGGFVVATLWPSAAILVKRIHDRNKSGWLALAYFPAGLLLLLLLVGSRGNPMTLTLMLVTTMVTVWFFVEFGCMPGTFGVNRYGPDPVLR